MRFVAVTTDVNGSLLEFFRGLKGREVQRIELPDGVRPETVERESTPFPPKVVAVCVGGEGFGLPDELPDIVDALDPEPGDEFVGGAAKSRVSVTVAEQPEALDPRGISVGGPAAIIELEGRRGSLQGCWERLVDIAARGEAAEYETSSPWLRPDETTREAVRGLVERLVDFEGFTADSEVRALAQLQEAIDGPHAGLAGEPPVRTDGVSVEDGEIRLSYGRREYGRKFYEKSEPPPVT